MLGFPAQVLSCKQAVLQNFSPSSLATTALATAFPTTLVALRPISSN
jgi:hypothetical protein